MAVLPQYEVPHSTAICGSSATTRVPHSTATCGSIATTWGSPFYCTALSDFQLRNPETYDYISAHEDISERRDED